ncbi:uncharacterized protein LOC141856094 [Brevipalpus obovatus]|uniref:uncharacterized protein LOC141856094 n=1 Tax=Brevipalpus obovatus TaxID=246614 RepID=UPI003D9EA13D
MNTIIMRRAPCNGLILLLSLFVLVSILFPISESSKGRTRTTSNPNDLVTFDDDEIDDENVTTTSDIAANSTNLEPVIIDYTTQDFNKECLNSHNNLRKSVGAPPLEIDPKIVRFAQKRAKRLALDNDTVNLRHDAQNYGENLMVWPSDGPVDCDPVIKMWFDEFKLISNWSDPESAGLETYHFTQVVWKQTKNVGCGAATLNGTGWVFISCNYDPPGNFLSEFPSNVLQPLDMVQGTDIDDQKKLNESSVEFVSNSVDDEEKKCECVCKAR